MQWLADYIEVGYGPTPGVQKFMNYWDRNFFAVNTIGFQSTDGTSAMWRFLENSGTAHFLHTITTHFILFRAQNQPSDKKP